MTEERVLVIKDAAIKLTNKLRITTYPIIMQDLFDKYYDDRYYIHFANFSEKADIVSNYYPETDECIIYINQKVFKPNLMKRLNFSLAHELGHLVLKHYIYAVNDNLPKWCELEADEFAAQFLMPDDEIYFMNRNLKFISEYFYVSQLAASLRLQNMKKRSIRPNKFLSEKMYEYKLTYNTTS